MTGIRGAILLILAQGVACVPRGLKPTRDDVVLTTLQQLSNLPNGPVPVALPPSVYHTPVSPVVAVEQRQAGVAQHAQVEHATSGGYGYPVDKFPLDQYLRDKEQERKEKAKQPGRKESISGAPHEVIEPEPCKGADPHGQPIAGLDQKSIFKVQYSDNGPYGYIQNLKGGGRVKTVRLSPPKEPVKKTIATTAPQLGILGSILGQFTQMINGGFQHQPAVEHKAQD